MLQFLKPGLGVAIFGLRLLVAFAAPPLAFAVFAHEVHPPAQSAATSDESAFLAENETAMNRMMSAMEAKPSGDIDRDFVAMMAPHHQGAIDMAVAVLRHGSNPQIRRLAQEIIVTQQQEIAAMRLAVGQPLPPSLPSPTQPSPRPAPDARTMQ
jgi:hypothetical protein